MLVAPRVPSMTNQALLAAALVFSLVNFRFVIVAPSLGFARGEEVREVIYRDARLHICGWQMRVSRW